MREPMDEGDMAQDYQSRHNADALAAHRLKACARLAESSAYCAWCEAEIPAARRRALPGCTLCVDCQAGRERLASTEGLGR